MSWFSWHTHRKRIIAIATIAAAISVACSSKPQDLPKLVDKSDKRVAEQLIGNPNNKNELSDVGNAEEMISQLFWRQEKLDASLRSDLEHTHCSKAEFYIAIKIYLEDIKRKVINLLPIYTDKLRKHDFNSTAEAYYDGATNQRKFTDNFIAEKLTKGVLYLINEWAPAKETIEEERVIPHLQEIQMVAKAAGFPETQKAAGNALINVRGFMAK